MSTTDPLQTPPLLGGRTIRALAIGVVASIQLIAGLFVVLNPEPHDARSELLGTLERNKTYRFTGTVVQVFDGRRVSTKLEGMMDGETSLRSREYPNEQKVDGPVMSQTTLSIGDEQYIRVDPLMRQGFQVPPGKRWVKMDYGPEGRAMLKRAQSLDPMKMLTDVRVAGDAMDLGRPVRHWTARIDFEPYYRAFLAGIGNGPSEGEAAIPVSQGTMDVFTDRAGHVVKMVTRMRTEVSDAVSTAVLTQRMTDHGKHFRFPRPTPSDVFVYDMFARIRDMPSQQPQMQPTGFAAPHTVIGLNPMAFP